MKPKNPEIFHKKNRKFRKFPVKSGKPGNFRYKAENQKPREFPVKTGKLAALIDDC
jgi:hypothetical protein